MTIRELLDNGIISLDTQVIGDGLFLTADGFIIGRNASIYSLWDHWRDGKFIHSEKAVLDRSEYVSGPIFGDQVNAAKHWKDIIEQYESEQRRIAEAARKGAGKE